MARTPGHDNVSGAARSASGPTTASQGLEWLWQHLRDIRHPHTLDCGPVSPSTLDALLRRGVKFYSADLITPLLHSNPKFWDRTGKTPVFLPSQVLAELPAIPPGSLSAILSWNLLDFVPHEGLSAVVERLFSLLQPLGVLSCILRDSQARGGPEIRWRLDTLTAPRCETDPKRPFPYPPITNREIERLMPNASIKTFLTRSGHREILAMRKA